MNENITQLKNVNDAIIAIESGAQSYKIGSQSVQRADLSTLYAERRRLESLASAQHGGMTVVRIGRRR